MNEQGNNPSSGLGFCLSHRVRRLEVLSRLSIPLEDKGSCKKSLDNNKEALKNSCKTTAVFLPGNGSFTVKPKRRLQDGCSGLSQVFLGDLRISGPTKLRGQSEMIPLQFPTALKTPL